MNFFKNFIKQEEKNTDWYSSSYHTVLLQRNICLFVIIISLIVIAICISTISYINSIKSLSPFVIEIEEKSGIPTVVDPVSINEYSANEVIKKYFIMKYIKAREEYLYSLFDLNYNTVVRVLSSSNVYYSDYKSKYSTKNDNSPYNLYGQHSTATLNWKSIIFPTSKSAQVRITVDVTGNVNTKTDKIIFMEFDFQNLNLTENERLINPLGFVVTLYRIEDENQ